MKNTLLTLLLLLLPTPSLAADLFTPEEKRKMIQLTLENFWGKAIDSKGEPVMPKDDKERATLPISREQAYYLINKGGESGLAVWCGVAWEERYQLTIEQLRAKLENDTQVAYAGVLHGVAQQMLLASLKDESCDDATKKQIGDVVAEDVKNLKTSLKAQ